MFGYAVMQVLLAWSTWKYFPMCGIWSTSKEKHIIEVPWLVLFLYNITSIQNCSFVQCSMRASMKEAVNNKQFLMPSVGGSINHILVWRVTVSIFSWTYAGIHVMAPGVTASFSLNFLNSSLLLNVHIFFADTKHERHFKITSVNW